MKTEKYTHLRAQVQKIEEKILAITGRNVDFNMEWIRLQRKYEQVEKLIWKRKHLLDEMFVATTEEVKRMKQLNNRLYDLTQKMLSRTEALYRNLMTAIYDPEFDDVEVEGSLRFSLNGQSSVLPMVNDDYYGSNFYEILCVIDWLYTCNHLGTEEIECINISLADYATLLPELRRIPDLAQYEKCENYYNCRPNIYERLGKNNGLNRARQNAISFNINNCSTQGCSEMNLMFNYFDSL